LHSGCDLLRRHQHRKIGVGSRHISGVSQAAGQTGAAAGEVLDSAKMLARLSDDLKRDVDRFVGDHRAA
jgi:methyl-accepting chemotaxis protein